MRSISFAACLYLLGAAQALPSVEANDVAIIETRADRGSYNAPGLSARKKAILSAGGGTLELAIAMLETNDMGTDYTYGDGKTMDASNFGIFKQNWGMLRVCAKGVGFAGQTEAEWNNGAKLNRDLHSDVAARQECQKYYGYDKWFGGHRDGSAGLANPNTADINTYKSGVQWIQKQIESNPKYKSDDTRFWVNVTPI